MEPELKEQKTMFFLWGFQSKTDPKLSVSQEQFLIVENWKIGRGQR